MGKNVIFWRARRREGKMSEPIIYCIDSCIHTRSFLIQNRPNPLSLLSK
jgi:hypothetical protein